MNAQAKSGEELAISPFSTVRQLREQRVYMCQTDNQYEFIYKFFKQF